MKVDILINQLDEHNEGNILATKKFHASEVIFLRGKGDEKAIKTIKLYYESYMSSIKIRDIIIEEGDIEGLRKLIVDNKEKNILVNLTGGKRINSLILLNICKENKVKSIYVDIKRKNLYTMDNKIEIVKEQFGDLDIEDIIEASGGSIVEESTSLCEKEDLKYLTKQIYNNLELWHKYKQKLYDVNIFAHDYKDSKKVTVNIEGLDGEEKSMLSKIIDKIIDMGGIECNKLNESETEVIFLKSYLKGFLFKSGTWLEIATNILVKEIDEIDQVKNGVIFLWNDNIKGVRNEVDVVAIKDSIPICISCKDSDKYNENALNELNVYSLKIGGKKAYKILVATKEPMKAAIKERAKEMGINIVIFNGDEQLFKQTIVDIIKQ
ncbi:MAG: Card1-like endonuclease domain-containing protein [Clostridium sp.]